MSKQKSDTLFQLIKSMKKAEKRYFKLSGSRDDSTLQTKYLKLFDLIAMQKDFDEDAIIKKANFIASGQFSNLKANLYKKVLQSLRQFNSQSVLDLQIRELIDYAQILFNRSLYKQCDSMLKKAKNLAKRSDNMELLLEILKWERHVLSQVLASDDKHRANNIIEEVQMVNNRINKVNLFTNLRLKLNSLYLNIGFIRSEEDFKNVQQIFRSSLPNYDENTLSLSEKMNLYSLYADYYFFIRNFEQAYVYAKKSFELFDSKSLIYSRLENYIKVLNSLMIAQARLFKYDEFIKSKRTLRSLRSLPAIAINENINKKLFKYTYVHEFNAIFMRGDFKHGVALINKIKPNLELYIDALDNHSRIILYYKIGCLYFGNDDFKEAISWLNRIINSENVDLRKDIHGFARILNLISHYELGNTDVLEYFVRSTYRFLLKKEELHQYQKIILNFLKRLSGNISDKEMMERFETLLRQLRPLVNNPFEKRAFIYFDIISWLESKIQGSSVQKIIKKKAIHLV